MKKLRILAVSLCMMLGLTLTSCVSAAAMADDSGVSVDILVAEGVPYYDANNVFLYYMWNGRYWYRYWYHDSWYYRPYLRPLPPGARPHFHRPGPGDRRIKGGPVYRPHPNDVHRGHRPDGRHMRPDRGSSTRVTGPRPAPGGHGGDMHSGGHGGGRPSGGFHGGGGTRGHMGGRR